MSYASKVALDPSHLRAISFDEFLEAHIYNLSHPNFEDFFPLEKITEEMWEAIVLAVLNS